jgi:hypothetical protein
VHFISIEDVIDVSADIDHSHDFRLDDRLNTTVMVIKKKTSKNEVVTMFRKQDNYTAYTFATVG